MIPFDVQLIGGMVLHSGRIAEMATGEGKTLVATLPTYLNALSGKGVHIVTVNDYLAARDADWMGEVYRELGLTVGCLQHGQTQSERRAQYACDITYGRVPSLALIICGITGWRLRRRTRFSGGTFIRSSTRWTAF